jgi:hypothetical protein
MKHVIRISSLSLITFIISLVITLPALAIPTLPSSFYGTVKVNNANVPDGTVIQALIGGQVYAEGFTQTYQGDSVYSLDVRGDDTDTTPQDGGREGETVQFKIGGVIADQTGVWHIGTNVNLNLTASTSKPVAAPQVTPTPVPTQTAIVVIQPSPAPATISQNSITPAPLIQPLPTLTQPVRPSETATKPSQPSPKSTKQVQPSLTSIVSENTKGNSSSNNVPLVVVIATLVVAIIVGFAFLVLNKKK